jgi:hypothetical protein
VVWYKLLILEEASTVSWVCRTALLAAAVAAAAIRLLKTLNKKQEKKIMR